jgi:PAS domain S-box-containing protein
MSENPQNEFSLFEQEERAFQAIFQSSNEAIIVADSKGIIQVANPVGERMFGYERRELQGKSVDSLVPAAAREKHAAYRQIYNADPQPRSMGIGRDLSGVRKDGSEFPIEVSLSHTKIQDEFIVVAFIIDISRRKKAEEALRRSEEQLITYATELENRVKKRTEDLNRTIKELEKTNDKLHKEISERMRAEGELRDLLAKEKDLNELKSRFVSMASHEFRTPLSSVLSSANLIQRYIENDQGDKTEKHLKRIKGSVKNLTDILNDFLSLGRLEEGKVDHITETLNLKKYFTELEGDVEGILKPGQRLKLEVPGDLELTTDGKILKNIFYNLISNSSKYSDDGKPIDVLVTKQDGHIKIDVQDYGMGIPQEEQAHMFERFFRAKNATNIQGTGLGLNIVKKYVELLNGEISFTSEIDEGTTFTVKIPCN